MAVKRKSNSTSYIFRIFLIVVLIFALFSLGSLQKQLVESKRELAELQQISEEKQLQVAELMSLLDNGTESDYIEKAAREKLGYVYSDEQVYVDLSGN